MDLVVLPTKFLLLLVQKDITVLNIWKNNVSNDFR